MKLRLGAAALLATLAAGAAFAQTPAPQPVPSPTIDKGDTAWMLVSSALVLMMSVPGLALFYGGLVRTKNMLSVLMQVFAIVSVAALVWVSWGYSLAFTEGSAFVGGLSKAFLRGVDATTQVATFSNGAYLPELVYVCFQMTFACITPALIVGAFAERVKFTGLMLFTVLWLTLVYFPIAHMVWYWDGPDAIANAALAGGDALATASGHAGYIFQLGALDFAGGTVVHINAGVAGLVGAIMLGRRVGYPREPMPPHSLVMTMIGASLLWIGWFGFNAGSNLEANGVAAVAFINTFVATAAAALSWMLVEQAVHGKPSMLGAVTGAVAGLVAVTPASGFAGPMGSIILGLIVSPICYLFVARLKPRFGYDDSLDVFGVHCVGGIVGALATGILVDPALGGQGIADYAAQPGTAQFAFPGYATQLWAQARAVLLTLVWSGVVSAILYFVIDKMVGLCASDEAQREGLDLSEHGERAYNF
ncbi:ammonium transporter [Sphingomonas lenta]|uniref:Ammonium transporter n=1 Tax=Sphingomonas lenta TaxID=1141887 RepID=A0A2A2SCN3_9SPHN|nr:ammonium transporter [Sphingomonas lenta]PAX06761.1 ammonia channel protein [Sphingomonas lenta]